MSIDHQHWAFDTDLSDVIHIRFFVIPDHDKLLTLAFIINFVVAFIVVKQQFQATLSNLTTFQPYV